MVEINFKKDVPKIQGQSAGVWNISAESQGAGVGAAISEGAAKAKAGFDKVGDKVDTISAQDAANKYSEYSRHLTIGNGLPDGDENRIIGYKALRGQEAIDNRQEYEEKLKKRRDELSAGLSSNARAKYDKVAQSHTARAQTAFGTHTLGAAEEVRTKIHTTNLAEQLQNAVANAATWAQTGSTVQASITAIGEAVRKENAGRFGDEVAQSMAESAMTKAHLAVIEALEVDSPAEAEAYLKEALKKKTSTGKPVMDADRLNALRSTLATSTRIENAQTFVDALELENADNMWDPKAQKDMWDKVKKNLSGKDEVAAGTVLKQRISLANAQRKGAVAEAVNEAYGFLYDNRDKTMADFRKEHPAAYKLVTTKEITMGSLTALPARLAANERYAIKPDHTLLSELVSKEVPELARVNPYEFEKRLTKDQVSTLRTKIDAAKKVLAGGKKTDPVFKNGYAALKTVSAVKLKWGSIKANDNQKALQQEARNDMNVFVSTFIARGEVPTPPQYLKEATRLMLKIVADPDNTGTGFTPEEGEEKFEGLVFQANNPDAMSKQQRAVARVPIKKINPDHRTNLIKAIRNKNADITITDDLLEEFAAANALRDGPRVKRILGIK